jgi:hypothetical protein
LQPGVEPRGTGVNKYSYWATNDCKNIFIWIKVIFSIGGMDWFTFSYSRIN